MPAPLHPVIAIDGTAASGKSTFARSLAGRLGFVYVNTGAMYRGVTWYMREREIPVQDAEAVAEAVQTMGIEKRLADQEFLFLIDGTDPLPHAREGRVNEAVSLVARVPAVRRLLVAEQQKLAEEAPLVMEGRDIGTVVFPQTPYKFYIDADAGVRSERRRRQGETDVILQRDVLDSQRQTSPLTCAHDAMRLDSGAHTVEELVAMAMDHLAARGFAFAAREGVV